MVDEFEVKGKAYTVIPEWILYEKVGASAVRLFGVLGRYLGTNEFAWPSRKKLSAKMGCSLSTVDRAIDELEKIGAIRVEYRYAEKGSQTSSLFYLWPFEIDPPLVKSDDPPLSDLTTLPSSKVIDELTLNERTKVSNSSTPTSSEGEKVWSDEVRNLTSELAGWISLNGFKTFTPGPKQYGHIDKMIRIDKRDPLEIYQVIQWCQKDAFWNSNILSTMKLRQQYDKLVGRMRAEGIVVGALQLFELSPEEYDIAEAYDAYDDHREWYNSKTGEFTLDNPSALGYSRVHNDQGQLIDSSGVPYTLDVQGVRRSIGG